MPTRPAIHRSPGYAAAKRATDQARKQRMPNRDRLYGRRWKKAAAAYLLEHPLCVECEREGRLTPATVVDHVIPHRGDPEKFWDGAWQSLCEAHHNAKTGRGQ